VRRAAAAVAVLGALFLAAHLVWLPSTLEDVDSVNFAMGVRDFDVARHQPHPPGYPVFIALGKIGTRLAGALGAASPDVRGLAIWSAIGGALLAPLLFAFFSALDRDDGGSRAAIATVVTIASPLVWFNAARPMSDVAGLAVAFAGLAALATLLAPPSTSSSSAAAPVAGAFLVGLSIGIRSQMAFLTLPFAAFVFIASRRHRLGIVGGLAAGVAIWAIPLIVLSGGPAGYLHALRSQAGEDFTGVVMLWTNPSPRVAFTAVLHTFVRPWESPVLAGVILALAAAGSLALVARAPKVLALVALTFGPYAIFHLLFQEPLTTRYALPLMPLVAYLAASAIADANARAAAIATIALAASSLVYAIPATLAFGREPSPVFALLSEIRMLQERGAAPAVGMHRRVFTESRRARAYAGNVPGTVLPTPRDYEWLELTRAWLEGSGGETWFVADPRRTDLALVDLAHTRTRQYRWPFNAAIYLGGARPNEIDWHVIDQPGWFLEQGWALTPETAGIADRDGWGPHRRPSVGWVRRRLVESVMMIGGRQLGGDRPTKVIASLDDRPVAALDVRPGFFLDFVTLPAGSMTGDGPFAKLTVRAESQASPVPPVAVEQFNVQPSDRVVFGFDEGWHEPEYNPTTARSWRWMSERAQVRVHHAGRSVALRMNGESPLHYFDSAPVVRISVGDRVLLESRPSEDFAIQVAIPADVLSAANGRITITSDRAYVAGEREGTADRRRLALKIYSLIVEPSER
jgi:hypothetical protein